MTSIIRNFRSNKRVLYAVAGVIGGASGALFAELVLRQNADASNRSRVIIETGLWSCVFATFLGAALFMASEWHQRRELKPGRLAKTLAISAAAGFLSGAGAQYLYSLDFGSWELRNFGLRVLAWAIMGALLGTMLSQSVPNLSSARGFAAGALGGALGCMGFLATSMFWPGIAGRVVGIALLGFALGLAMYFVEDMFSEASIEVEWAPYETSRVGLGPRPVFIGGGGEEHIFKKGLPPAVSSIVFKNGLIEHVETANGKRTPLQDGSRLRIGGLNLVVHAVSGASSQQATKRPSGLIAMSIAGAVILAGATAMTVTGLGQTPPAADTARGAAKITTLDNVGDSATLDTSVPITEVNVRLQWQAAVDLDLNAFYTLKSGDYGEVRYSNKIGPNMRLDTDAGVGDAAGQNEENITITALEDFKDIWFATDIFSRGGSYSDYDGRVTLETNTGETIAVPLTSPETKPYLVIAKLIDSPEGPTVVNLNEAVDCEGLVALLGRGECGPQEPKTGTPG
jgi:hypothetical protein